MKSLDVCWWYLCAPDPDFWSAIRQNYEIFLHPAPDWISFLLKPDPDYPKPFEYFLIIVFFFPAKILLITWEFWCWVMWFILFFNLSRMVDFYTAVVRWRESHVLQSPLAMAVAFNVRHVSKVGVLFAPSKKPTFQKLSNVSMCIQSVAGWDWVSQH